LKRGLNFGGGVGDRFLCLVHNSALLRVQWRESQGHCAGESGECAGGGGHVTLSYVVDAEVEGE